MNTPLEQVSKDMLLGHFINGLKDEIKVEVRSLHLMSLEQAMELAVVLKRKRSCRLQVRGKAECIQLKHPLTVECQRQ